MYGRPVDAALFSEDDLSIFGTGSLTVEGNSNDGISSNDGLVSNSGNISVTSVDDGIRGKDYLVIRGGTVTVEAVGDGFKSTNEEDEARGYVLIEDGVVEIVAGGDGVQAETDALIAGGQLTVLAGGGNHARLGADESAKGVKAGVMLVVDGGTLVLDAADDALHSSGTLWINGGSSELSTGDDGIHADDELVINDGEISILTSYEGIENTEADLTINGGSIHVVSTDDGINLAGAGDAGPGMPGGGGSGNYYLYLNGGTVVVDADGDGLDVNGSFVMSDCQLIVHEAYTQVNSPIDVNNQFQMNGGFLVGTGAPHMAQGPGTISNQYALLFYFSGAVSSGTLIHLESNSGEDLLTFAPGNSYGFVAFSSPELSYGTQYKMYLGGSSSGSVTDGLYAGGTYTPGHLLGTFKISGVVTQLSVS